MLEMRLFGPYELRAGGRPVVLASARGQALLAYLAMRHGEPQRRDRLASLLWPESAEGQARTNLRHVLHALRAALPEGELLSTAQTVALREVASDVATFDAAVAGDDPVELRAAADLYRGDLLDGWYEDWVVAEREEYRRRVTALLTRLAEELEPDAAVPCAERAIALDRLAERPYRALIRLHAARGDRARAVRVYHECAAVLAAELGVEPSAETRAAYRELLPAAAPAPRTGGAPTFVGRRAERQRLIEIWRRVGPPRLVAISGEPGIGKTRLAEEFRQWAAQHGASTATARSYAAEGTLAYAPVVAWLRGLHRWRAQAERGILARLLPEPGVEPEQVDRLRLFDAIVAALHAEARPLLLIADDLHAADPDTLRFLHYLLRSPAPVPLVVAATVRLTETDPDDPVQRLLSGLRAQGRCDDLPLDRLDREETAALAARHGHRLSTEDADRLHADTAGNPLFVVEALRAGLEVLTPRVQAVLEARLLGLTAGARELAGLAAVAGASVSVDVLERVHPDAAADLDELWRRQVLLTAGGDTYDFSHDRLREVAYRMLSPARRRHHHGLIARALQPDGDAAAGRIAAHLAESGARDEAVDWYLRGARAAQRVFADAQAAELLLTAARSVRGGERELEVLTAIPGPLSSAEGYASPRLRAVLDRAFAIAGPEPGAPLLRAQAMAVLSRGDFAAAVEYGARLHALGGPEAVEGDFVRGVAAAWRDDLAAARAHLTAAIEGYRPQNRAAHVLAYGTDPRVLCLARLAHVQHRLGDPAAARRRQAEALAAAHQLGHPFTLAAALLFAAVLDLDLDDRAALRGRVAELAGLRERIEAPPIRLVTDALTGLLEVFDDPRSDGLSRIDAALADPGRATAPGVPAMLLRIRLAATRAAGRVADERATAERLLADGVRVWDSDARGTLAERTAEHAAPHDHD